MWRLGCFYNPWGPALATRPSSPLPFAVISLIYQQHSWKWYEVQGPCWVQPEAITLMGLGTSAGHSQAPGTPYISP